MYSSEVLEEERGKEKKKLGFSKVLIKHLNNIRKRTVGRVGTLVAV